MLQRMVLFVRGLIYQANRCQLPCELVLVEWNPPAGTEPLANMLPKPTKQDFLTIRYIVVPPEVHAQFNDAAKLPLYQMVAKNVGIRRAKADWILCTNVDLLFSDPLFDWLTKEAFDQHAFYRAHRCDIPREVDYAKPIPSLINWAEQNILRRAGKFPGLPLLNDVEFYPIWLRKQNAILKILHWIKDKTMKPADKLIFRADLWACGDFTMMHKDKWLKMEGYLEFHTYSLHIDSLGIFSALAIGLKQVTLPMEYCTYHIFHENGWESFETPVQQLKFVAQKHTLDWASVRAAGLFIMQNQQTWGLNPANWGLADVVLNETVAGNEE